MANHIDELPVMMDVQETAQFLRVGKQSVYRLAKQDGFPSVVVGGKIRILRDRLMTWLENEMAQPGI